MAISCLFYCIHHIITGIDGLGSPMVGSTTYGTSGLPPMTPMSEWMARNQAWPIVSSNTGNDVPETPTRLFNFRY
jgi:hypothetical protein